MEFKVIWSHFAEEQIDEIFEYYKSEANLRIAKKMITSLISATEILENNPEIGQVEELLYERKEIYRYLVHKKYKIIYSIDTKQKRIKIADVFDTRQNPVKITRNK